MHECHGRITIIAKFTFQQGLYDLVFLQRDPSLSAILFPSVPVEARVSESIENDFLNSISKNYTCFDDAAEDLEARSISKWTCFPKVSAVRMA